jgi:hypothetical protein
MALYAKKKDNPEEFLNQVQYPELPMVKPLCGTKEFRLSDVYITVVAHAKNTITEWFQKRSTPIDMENTIWVVTVPAIATAQIKEFMRAVFIVGMGEVNGQKIRDDHLFCVLEPEGAFLYALH